VVHVAFAIDVFSRRIVGWKADTTMRTRLVLDTLEMALWTRDREGLRVGAGLILPQRRRPSIPQLRLHPAADRRWRGRLRRGAASATPTTNAVAEPTIGLFKTEKIRRAGPW
jgi:putative transposase